MFYYRFMWTSMGSLDEANVLPRLPAPLKAQMDIVLTRKIFVSIPVFHSCEPEEILRMVQGLVPHLALPGDVIIEEGTIGLGLFFIMRGAVSVVRKLKEARLSETGQVGAPMRRGAAHLPLQAPHSPTRPSLSRTIGLADAPRGGDGRADRGLLWRGDGHLRPGRLHDGAHHV